MAEVQCVSRQCSTQRLHLLDDTACTLIRGYGFLGCDFTFLES